MSSSDRDNRFDHLTREERITLVQQLWDSIAAESEPPLLTEAQREELRRRVAEDDAKPDDGLPWEEVKAKTLSRIKP